MFSKLIYYDKDRIDEFISLIKEQNRTDISEIRRAKKKSGKADFKVFGAEAEENTSYTASVKQSLLLELFEFEKTLEKREDYFDFFKNEYSMETIGRGNIIKMWGTITVPEAFDLPHTLKRFKPFLITSMQSDKDFDDDSLVAMDALINSDDETKIPVVLEHGEVLMSAMLNSKHLKCSFEELEDIEDDEVTVIARTANTGIINKTKAYYDPLKDFMSLNRAMRRSMINDRGEGLEALYLEKDYFKIEIVAIYQ